jgi:hypothetical protein
MLSLNGFNGPLTSMALFKDAIVLALPWYKKALNMLEIYGGNCKKIAPLTILTKNPEIR